jgi:hypothetical protein
MFAVFNLTKLNYYLNILAISKFHHMNSYVCENNPLMVSCCFCVYHQT